ncbi:hypothetical protein RM533_02065 [Croceicoccus sp. F390]|uniref:Uncharacterized protein n=1 Tax=Croceicoccus esteveae TaxID=3075597 RepID=A0ABU2ZF34_9SPHN|nr:hypothetical protein [Croceicoccus sp. F390]MDT0574966.1 hypothetical protein [Croceicoccus sp. F390]
MNKSDYLFLSSKCADEAVEQIIKEMNTIRRRYSRPSIKIPALLTLAVIHLGNGLQLLNKLGKRVNEKGLFIQTVGKEGDLTSLIIEARNAACHINSRNWENKSGGYLAWTSLGPGMKGVEAFGHANATSDDWMFLIGSMGLYLHENLGFAADTLRKHAKCLQQQQTLDLGN